MDTVTHDRFITALSEHSLTDAVIARLGSFSFILPHLLKDSISRVEPDTWGTERAVDALLVSSPDGAPVWAALIVQTSPVTAHMAFRQAPDSRLAQSPPVQWLNSAASRLASTTRTVYGVSDSPDAWTDGIRGHRLVGCGSLKVNSKTYAHVVFQMDASIHSLQVGLPKSYAAREDIEGPGGSYETAISKEPVDQPVYLARENLAGDRQADLVNHGGPDKAVLAYSLDHYDAWSQELRRTLGHAAFGENFTMRGLSEAEVCLGDVVQIGEAILQVAQPRQPCWKLSRKHNVPDMVARVRASGRTGWYYRVLREGWVRQGDLLCLLERHYPEWTVARANRVLFGDEVDVDALEQLSQMNVLAPAWRKSIDARLTRQNRLQREIRQPKEAP